MPIPNYLQEIAYDERQKGSFTSFRLKCKCGCTLFHVYESYLDKKEKELCKPYYDALDKSLRGCFSSCTEDENGVIHHWIYLSHSRNGPKEEVFIPPKPICACITVYKVCCTGCGTEYVIYDSRLNGYSGVFCADPAQMEYIPHYRLKKRRDGLPVEISICVEHIGDYEEFNKEIQCEYKEYTNAYSWIAIYSTDANNKKRKLFDAETD